VEKFKYLGATLRDQNYMHKEIKGRLNLGNACYHSAQSLLSSCLLSRNLKVEPAVPEPSASEAEDTTAKMKSYKLPGVDQIPQLIQAAGKTLWSEICKLIQLYNLFCMGVKLGL
jgi:hypothetical protein